LAIRCRVRPRCAHISVYALLAAADQVSARIAAVLDGEAGARWWNCRTAWTPLFKGNPLAVLPEFATVHRAAYRDTLQGNTRDA
jgi:hypothetical protein